ncbi:glycosyltransferase family 2 protein [Asanoa sp. WMMD1127]|uniref:glycosyltransferase family 2 protein n=1 Tax=Asanoa sp. WMMD1127 TaxID=3016107 RepID=UPI002417DF8E|nr:glycosyltransferase family 2 protein [Asanoa sp. WMMD1127]MDG4820296.1 glycosyltransferase family 2 protein [Asanoa sp. WMMD1127]
MALLSVVVPVYRVEDYLPACLDSILGQGFDDLELVAVDDASDDGSAAILADYAARDSRVRVLTLPVNRGLGAARNAGLAASTGDYVWFVDSDDWLTDGTLWAVADRLAETNADLLVTGFARVFPNGAVKENKVSWAGPTPETFRLAQVPGLLKLLHIACNKVVRRQLLVDLGLAFRPGWYEDVAFSLPLMIAADRITLLDRYSYAYRQRATGSITRTVSDRHFEVFDQWEFVFRFLGDRAEELRAPVFARAVWHLLQVLNHGARVPPGRRREFFARLVAFHRAERPAGGYPLPPGDEGVKHRLVAHNAFLLFEALRAGRKMQVQMVKRATRPAGAKPRVSDAVP